MLYSQSPPLAENETAQDDHSRFPRGHEERAEPQFGRKPVAPPLPALPARSSLGRRMFRSVAKFAIVLFLGIGGTLGWQAYGDMAKQMLAARAPQQAWLLSWIPTAKPSVAVAAAANPTLQLEPLASNLEFVRRSVEQIALKQEQMIRNLAALQAADEEIRQKVSAPPPAPATAQPAVATPLPRPAPPKLQPPPGAPSPAPAPRPSASAAAPVALVPR